MNREWEMVKEFHERFGHPVADRPCLIDSDRAKRRYAWMLEELNEFLESEGDIVEQADAMIDLIYFALGTLVEMGIKPDEPFAIVQGANMSKLWPDGKPHFRADGKTIKPSTWIDPHPVLARCIEKMLEDESCTKA